MRILPKLNSQLNCTEEINRKPPERVHDIYAFTVKLFFESLSAKLAVVPLPTAAIEALL